MSEYLMHKADRAQDSGLYIMWLRIDAPCRVQIGALGEMAFPAGVYAYVGSAQRSRMARIRRHLRSDKPLRWHFDYLRSHGSVFAVSLARGAKAEECGLARSLRAATRAVIAHPRFGASDCRCPGHLLYLPAEPDYSELDGTLGLRTVRPDQIGGE